MKRKTIDSYFSKAQCTTGVSNASKVTSSHVPNEQPNAPVDQLPNEQSSNPNDATQGESTHVPDDTLFVRDPALRKPISSYPPDQQQEIIAKFVEYGPYRLPVSEYPPTIEKDGHVRRFQAQWLNTYNWLEHSLTNDAAYCFPCFLFGKKPLGKLEKDAFTVQKFKSWKRVGGKQCAFETHIGNAINSAHGYCVQCWYNFKNPKGHVNTIIEKLTPKQIADNRTRLSASIEVVRWLTFQKCAFRGHDESTMSKNQGNFLELLKLLASHDVNYGKVVLENAPQNAKYIASSIQKEILHVFAQKVRKEIRKEIGDSKFCIIIDESRDISKKEQMAIILRFVDKHGIVQERFLELVHVKDTTSKTLHENICAVLSNHELSIDDLRGQGYDGASNMRGEWNGLQALFMKDCPYAYYVHCQAHQLQLALSAAVREVSEVHDIFKDLLFIVNTVSSSSKRHDELQDSQVTELEQLIEIEELTTGTGLNQIGTLQRPGDTRGSSHYKSICSLLRMFNATRSVLEKIATDRNLSYAQRGDAKSALKRLLAFDFIFILHMMEELMSFTDKLCRALQYKSLDILNATDLLSTKMRIQEFRDDGWDGLSQKVALFCDKHSVLIPDMSALYADIIRSRSNNDKVSVEHHYRVDIFAATMDQQLQQLNSRFSEQTTELLILSSALNPKDGYKHFNVGKIYRLAKKYYSTDFSEFDEKGWINELELYYRDVPHHAEMKNLSTISDLCRSLTESGKFVFYPLVYKLIRLVLTLPVTTATTERAFSAMKIVNTTLRNKMEDEFLSDYLTVYIEKEIAEIFMIDSIIEGFSTMKVRRAHFE